MESLKPYVKTSSEVEQLFTSRLLPAGSIYTIDQIIEKVKVSNIFDNIVITPDTSIAIVGNSGILLEREYAEEIDSNDIVIRCNLAPVKGFEEYTGTKTSIRMVSGKAFFGDEPKRECPQYDDNFYSKLVDQNIIIKANPLYDAIKGIIKHFNTSSYINYLDWENVIPTIESNTKVHNPSLGFTAICLAKLLSDNISVFGFTFMGNKSAKHHYYGDTVVPGYEINKITRNENGYYRNHDFSAEQKYIEFLQEQNLIKVFE